MKRYDNYKDSGIEWLGEIPTHWEVKRMKYLCDITTGGKDTENREDDGKYPFFVRSQTIERISSFSFDGEAILTAGDGVGVCKVWHYVDEKFDFHQRVYMMSEFQQVLGKYLFYYLKENFGKEVMKLSAKSTVDSLRRPMFQNFMVCFGTMNEQKAIVYYLDSKTTQIDSLISKKQQFITLLQEERIAVINKAVTKGLNPKVTLKNSGVEWLGKIPEHWEMKPLKYLVKNLLSGVSVNSHDVPTSNNEEFGILKTSCVYDYTFRPIHNKKVLKEEYNRVKCSVEKDTIIISRMNTPELVGASGYVSKDYPNLFLPDRLWKTEFFNDVEINVKWLSQVLISDLYKKALSSKATGTSPSMKNISKDDFLTLQIPYSPLSEQNEIAKFLLIESERVDEIILKTQQEIELLKEYKTALISEVVTGKMDVRDVVLN